MKKHDTGLWSFNTRDLMRSSGCQHCSQLAIARELDVAGVRDLVEQYFVEPESLAITYGMAYEEALEQELLAQLGPEGFQRPADKDTFDATVALMREQVPVIYQGYLKHQVGNLTFNGKPDFLVRGDYQLEFVKGKLTANQKSTGEKDKYVAWDAKLASTAKPNYLLQIALYADALKALGMKSEGEPGIILGSRTLETFEESEIVPAMQQARKELEAAIKSFDERTALADLTLYCDTKDSCSVCEYPALCEQARFDVDHLVQVAGINRNQIEKLSAVGITTMASLAKATDDQRPSEITASSFEKIRLQAKLQTDYRKTGEVSFIVLPDPEIAVLPPASQNDVFFDMEGFPYFPEKGGLEYLFGNTLRTGEFVPFFAHDRKQEKQAFIDFMEFLNKKLEADKSAHVYHYANYEVTALNRLAARHGVMEAQVAELVSSGRMVDLYKVVKGSIMVSQPSYSIKKLEAFYEFDRKSKVLDAGASIDEYDYYRQQVELGEEGAEETLKQITVYNEDDCVSTMALYNWLSTMPGAHSRYQEFERAKDIKKAREARSQAEKEDSPESARARKAEFELEKLNKKTAIMQKALDGWAWGKDSEADYRAKIWLALTHSMLYYNREDVIRWRDWAIRKDATFDQLHRDRKALVVQGCTTESNTADFFGVDPDTKVKLVYRYVLEPGQTSFLKKDQKLFVRYSLGANQQDTDYGKVISVVGDELIFERDARYANMSLVPNAIFEYEWVPPGQKPEVVGELVQELVGLWGSPLEDPQIKHPAMDLLMRNNPRLKSLPGLPVPMAGDALNAITEAVMDLDTSVLAIQGPPGSGKTFVGSRVIKELVDKGMKVGVVANSHSAIENLLWACLEAGVSPDAMAKKTQAGDKEAKGWLTPTTNKVVGSWRAGNSGYVFGGTSWSFCAKEMFEEQFDYIFIDEAAQFSLVDAIAVSANTKNLVLLGDPRQLTQVVQAIHPGGVDNSALGYYMGDAAILESSSGYFLDVTRRMHPAINAPVSNLSYQNKLHSHPDTHAHVVAGVEPGLVVVPVEHRANVSSSIEEAKVVLEIAQAQVAKLGASEVLIVAPYNAQVDLIRQMLDKAGLNEVAVGTVDKFQGREAMVVIVSLAASSALDAPRGLDFLLDRNRLNVALSRAKANCYLVYSPALTKSRFRNIEELKSVSRLNGLLEQAS
ncbi:MAG: TM0106 family RecB-like putative nuclease [Actinobacteria bacterium]|nr:TM0106 family RecB-like putative nuclease [Actinomycetota bacterium]